MPEPRAVFFDVFGTVVDWRTAVIRDASAFGERQGLTRDWAAFADDWRALYQPAMEAVRSGARGFVPLDVLHRENLSHLLRRYEILGVAEEELDWLNRSWHRVLPWQDTVPGLTRLRTLCPIAPVSNGNLALMTHLARYAALPWDVILGAEVAQAYKPMPEAYIRSAAALTLAPSQCMMVAAHNNDLHAAREAGLLTAFVPRPLEHGPGQTLDLVPDAEWDLIAHDFIDLAEQLGA